MDLQIRWYWFKKIKKKIKSSRSYNVTLETATYNLILPYEYLRDIERDLEGIDCDTCKEGDFSSYYEIRCYGENDTLPDFQLNINGTILTIPAKYIFELSETNHYARIYFTRSEELYVIGSPFLFAYHTLFDSENEKLHFYPNFKSKVDEKENKEEEDEKENEKENEKETEKEKEKEDQKEDIKEDEKETEKETENKKNLNYTKTGTDTNESKNKNV